MTDPQCYRPHMQRLLVCVLLFFSASASAQENSHQQPNIIFILTDDLGYGDIGVFFQNQRKSNNDRSEPWMATPKIDELAREGTMLTQHYCAAPVCAPSRASILSGLSQGHANVRDNQFDKALEDNYTMGSTLQKLGYATAAIGKWGLQGDNRWDKNGDRWPAHPLNRGFDYFFGYIRHVDGHEHYPKEGLYRGKKEVYENRINITGKLDKCYTADLWTAAAKHWIKDFEKSNSEGKPFFMYLAYETPHAVLELPAMAYPAGGGLQGGVQWLGRDGHFINTAGGKPDSYVFPDYDTATYDDDKDPATAEKPWPDVYKRYATSVRRIDTEIGDLVQLLKDLNIDKNTLVVFTSDNGPSIESYLPENITPEFFNSFGPFDGIKRDCWEAGIRVPTIAWWPGKIAAGQQINSPSISYDWLSTFTDAAGTPAPARVDGTSLLPSLTGKNTSPNSRIYVEYFQNQSTPSFEEFVPAHRGRKRQQMQVVRIGDTVGVRYDIQFANDNFEIYDIVNDPQEAINMSGNVGMEKIQREMKTLALTQRMSDTSAPRTYDDVFMPAVTGAKAAGLLCKSFNVSAPWIPDVSSREPVSSKIVNGFQTDRSSKGNIFLLEGFIEIPADGSYTFFIENGAHSILKLHEALVIDNDYHGINGAVEGTVKLSKGLHPIRLYLKDPRKDFKLSWGENNDRSVEIPPSVLFHLIL